MLHLSSLSKLLGWLQVYEPSKAAAYQKLGQQVKNYKKQLNSISKPERMDMPKLLRQGLAVPYEQIITCSNQFTEMVLAQCETGPLSSELAVQLNQCLLLQFYTAVPAQRAPAIYSMQVVDASEDLHRPKGNYAMLQPSSGVWSLTFNEHKTDKHGAMPSFELPPDGQFSMVLSQWLSWGESKVLSALGYPALEDTQGCAFLNTLGKPFTAASFYNKFVGLLKQVCAKPDLQISPNVLRHLLADSPMFDAVEPGVRESLARLAGHSLHTEQTFYKSPAKPTSHGLTQAAAVMNTLSKTPSKRPCSSFLSVADVNEMSKAQRLEAFTEMYGHECCSGRMVPQHLQPLGVTPKYPLYTPGPGKESK